MNIAVRTAEGTDGPVILSAFCPTCHTDAMPMDNGCCGFCDTQIVSDPKVDAALEAAGVLDGGLTEREVSPQIGPDRLPIAGSPIGVGSGGRRPTGAQSSRSVSPPPVASLARLLADAGDLLDAIAVASVRGR